VTRPAFHPFFFSASLLSPFPPPPFSSILSCISFDSLPFLSSFYHFTPFLLLFSPLLFSFFFFSLFHSLSYHYLLHHPSFIRGFKFFLSGATSQHSFF
ncbi:hypothetical protein, partial [Escherichia coli]|uniref:hypothetical protein n=1 Tax=Escherichia coli TaxID=562 RepID=UPI002B247E65